MVTLHRPANVDTAERLTALVHALVDVATRLPVVFPIHPRTRARLEAFGLWERLSTAPGMVLTGPLGYVDFGNLTFNARMAITDSGGVQEETTYLGIPCLTLRENTERPVTITEGSNKLIKIETLAMDVDRVLAGPAKLGRRPEKWDGRTAERVAASLRRHAGC